MASRTKFTHSKIHGLRYLEFLYWTPIRRYKDRYAMVFSMGDGFEALSFFNASKKSPRGNSAANNFFYPPPHGEFSRWYEEVAKFPKPRSNGERCSGFKSLMKAQFWEGEITERWDDFGNRIFEIALMTLRPRREHGAKDGWEVFEDRMKEPRNVTEEQSNRDGNIIEPSSGIPF